MSDDMGKGDIGEEEGIPEFNMEAFIVDSPENIIVRMRNIWVGTSCSPCLYLLL